MSLRPDLFTESYRTVETTQMNSPDKTKKQKGERQHCRCILKNTDRGQEEKSAQKPQSEALGHERRRCERPVRDQHREPGSVEEMKQIEQSPERASS